MKLKSEHLWLRPINSKDTEKLREWRNKYREYFFDSGEITNEQHKMWYTKYTSSPTDTMFIITLLYTGQEIGTIALYNIDTGSRTAEVGRIILLDEFRGHGYAEEAVKCLVDYAFNNVRLWKLRVEAFLDNLDAIAVYARAGFKTARPRMILERTNAEINRSKPVCIEELEEE